MSGQRHHHSLEDVWNQLHVEDLLDHGSLASCASADPALLDEDSDDQADTMANPTKSESCTLTPMAIDESTPKHSTDTCDPLYHQYKTARRTAFIDKLVSVLGDGTFGSCVSSQSSPVGSLTDHEGLEQTFN